jgi:hypothetical protein
MSTCEYQSMCILGWEAALLPETHLQAVQRSQQLIQLRSLLDAGELQWSPEQQSVSEVHVSNEGWH